MKDVCGRWLIHGGDEICSWGRLIVKEGCLMVRVRFAVGKDVLAEGCLMVGVGFVV